MPSSHRTDRAPLASPLFLAGALTVLGSVAAAVWMLSLGDVVTALGLTLLVAAGLLLAGIDRSPGAASP
jgi:hypothetical protein